MALNESIQDTDVWNSPTWLRATAQGRGRLARLARERLASLTQERQHEGDRAQQASQFAASHAQTERLRQDALNESRQRFALGQEQQREFHDQAKGEADLRAKVAQQQADTQRLNTLQLQLSDPAFKAEHPAIKNEIMRIMGIQNNVGTGGAQTPAAAAGKGEYGPGGAPKPAVTPAPNAPNAGGAPPTTQPYTAPTAAFSAPAPNSAVGESAAQPPNTPEQRFVPLGHGSLEGSQPVTGGIQTPSGGFIGTPITSGVNHLINPGAAVTAATNPPPNENMVAAPVGAGYTPPTTAFTTGGGAAQPAAAPAPASNAAQYPAPIGPPQAQANPGAAPIDIDRLIAAFVAPPTQTALQNTQKARQPEPDYIQRF